MKNILVILTIGTTLLLSCKGVKSASAGLDRQSYLVILGNTSNYREGVEVIIDDKPSFIAKVNKVNFKPSRDKVYGINPGTYKVTIKSAGKVIYKQDIFVSTQETKKITLP
jgi:ribosomal protein L21E